MNGTQTIDLSQRLSLTRSEAAAALGISERTLWSQTSPRGPIPCKKIAGRITYPVDAIREWLSQSDDSTTN